MTNLDKLLKEFKEARSAATEVIDTNDYRRRLGSPWYFGKPVYAQDLMKIQKANQIKSEWADYAANKSDKLIKIIEVMRNALNEIKANGHSDLCQLMKPVRPSYRCTFEDADEALQQAEKIAGEHG